MSSAQAETSQPENAPEPHWKGLAKRIAALTAFLLVVGGLLDAILADASKTKALTCFFVASHPWCDAPKMSSDRPTPQPNVMGGVDRNQGIITQGQTGNNTVGSPRGKGE